MTWFRRIAWILIVAAGVYFFHARLLDRFGRWLVVDQNSPRPTGGIVLRSDDGCTPDGENAYRVAAQLYRESPTRQILFVRPATPRLVATGAVPSFETSTRRVLARYGVPDQAIRMIPADVNTVFAEVRTLGEWLKTYPDTEVIWICGRFSSARKRGVIDRLLQPEVAGRIHVRALPRRQFDEHNWWRDREGVKAFLAAALEQGYYRWHGERTHTGPRWNPDEYQRQLIEARSGATP